MLVDLGRNDVGKVAQMGSVNVETFMEVERYSHVMHISSTVKGRLLPELNAWDVMRAALPAGTVSGAPKVCPQLPPLLLSNVAVLTQYVMGINPYALGLQLGLPDMTLQAAVVTYCPLEYFLAVPVVICHFNCYIQTAIDTLCIVLSRKSKERRRW